MYITHTLELENHSTCKHITFCEKIGSAYMTKHFESSTCNRAMTRDTQEVNKE